MPSRYRRIRALAKALVDPDIFGRRSLTVLRIYAIISAPDGSPEDGTAPFSFLMIQLWTGPANLLNSIAAAETDPSVGLNLKSVAKT